MSREKMAHIEEIVDVSPIEGADLIEVVAVLGWKCVAKKGDFKVGDKCVYVEIDSICPPTEMFKFLKDRKYRIRTIKLRKQISQGLALPIDDAIKALIGGKDAIGDDVTEALGITKYESPSDAEANRIYESKVKNSMWAATKLLYQFAWFRWLYRVVFPKKSKGFPSWIKKTDEERIQSNPTHYLSIKDKMYATEKLDGQSATYFIKREKGLFGIFGKIDIGLCSRNLRVGENGSGSWPDVFKRLGFKEKLRAMYAHMNNLGLDCHGVAFQGEIIGPEIQCNKYKRTENEFYMFNAMWLDGKGVTNYLTLDEMVDFTKRYSLKMVPILDKDFVMKPTLEEMLAYAEDKSIIIKQPTEREGVVFRTHDQKVSFKAISNKFLLKYKGEDEAYQAEFKKKLDEKSQTK